jgi:probable F420-dependent oxidoreductase
MRMDIGVVFPQTEFGNDPVAIREYAQAVEGWGFSHVIAYDHVLGANPDRPGGWSGPYTYKSAFHEPFILFAHMAAVTQTLGFAPGIIILPQRQTALVAKQAASLDVLSNGRLRLGVGLGWNPVEYIALAEKFSTRGRRMEEQVVLLRKLWTQPLVTFEGRWHTIPDAGINPLPVQRPIPIWFGGRVPAALRRAARLADGWMTNHPTPVQAREALDVLFRTLDESGRDRAGFGIEARIPFGDGDVAHWETLINDWMKAGATCFSFNTMGHGFAKPGEHLKALEKIAGALALGS